MSAKPWLDWPQARAKCGVRTERRVGRKIVYGQSITTARLIHPDGGWVAESKLAAIHRLHPEATWHVTRSFDGTGRIVLNVRWATGALNLRGTHCLPEAPIERKPRARATIEQDAEDNELPCGVAA